MTSTAIDRERLGKLLDMLGSGHDGEIVAAGRAADALVRRAGLTWFEVLYPQSALPEPSPETDFETVANACAFCLQRQHPPLSGEQAAVLDRLIAKVQYAERRGRT